MHRRLITSILLLLVPLILFCQNPVAKVGIIDIRNHNFSKAAKIKLNGDWKFYENNFLLSEPKFNKDSQYVFAQVPLSWDNLENTKSTLNSFGYGTYSLKILRNKGSKQTIVIKEIGSCYKVWINGQIQTEVGKLGKDKLTSIPSFQSFDILLPDTEQIELVIEVANFHQAKGGLRSHLILIENRQVNLFHERKSLALYFCLGIIFIIGLYHIGLFILNFEDIASMYFGLFCFDIFVFSVFRSRIAYYFYPEFDWTLGNKIEYIALYASLPLFYIFFYESFPRSFKKSFNTLAMALAGGLIAIVLFSETHFFTKTLTLFHGVLLFYIVVVLVGLIKSWHLKQIGTKVILLGFIVFMTALINDILFVQNIIDTDNLILVGVLGFVICQAYFLAYRSVLNQKNVKLLSIDLKELNTSLERFVPADFMHLLQRKSITEVSLGNYIEKEMTIMFSDIRSFTAISEKLSSEESFGFINEYLQVMAPIIRKHNGFIDKYIGDGIMALFPRKPEDAILCSQEMMLQLKELNAKNDKLGKPVVEIGIGLHTGLCILGTVGEPRRMDTTVISDSVNLAARIESLTKHYKTPIIISGNTYKQIDTKHQEKVRFIGTAVVKGKTLKTDLYKVFFDVDEIDTHLLNMFDKAITHFYKKEFTEAKEILYNLSNTPLNDGVLQLYLKKAEYYQNNGTTKDWQTFEVFEY